MTTLATLTSAPKALTSATLSAARDALAEVNAATDPRHAREQLRRALFHDRLPVVEMAGDAYLVLRDALLPPAEDDFARRCDVVAGIMVARSEGRLRLSLEAALTESLAEMQPGTRKSAAAWLFGQLFEGDTPRVPLVDARETARRLRLASQAS